MSIAQKAVRGVAWNMSTGVGARIIQLVGTLLLTRFIAPAEYGEISAAAVCVQTATQLSSFAFGQYLIAKRPPPEVAFQAAILHFGTGAFAMAIVMLLTPRLGVLVDAPAMARFVPGFIVAQLIDRVRYVPERLLVRDLRFRTVAIVNSIGEILYTITAVSFAPRYGGMALVAGWLVRSTFQAVLFLYHAPRAEWLVPSPLRAAAVRALWGYGGPIMIGGLADFAATRWDNLVISRLFGPAIMGRYNLAYSLAETPISYVAEHIGDVLMPSYSRMEPEQRKSAVVRAAGLMGLVVSPLAFGLGAVSPTVVHTFFDARWAPMAPMLVILSVMTMFRPITWSATAFLQAQQHVRLIMVMSFFRAALLLSVMAIAGKLGGPLWACASTALAFSCHSVTMIILTGRTEQISARDYLLNVARPVLACIPMFIGVLALARTLTAFDVPGVVSLVLQVVLGGVLYVAAAFVFARALANDLLTLLRKALRR